MKSLKKNFIYNISYQILLILLPFITMPYVSRIIGANGIGEYSYTYSIVNYFMLIAMLGINNYGNRSIAKARDDKIKMSKVFYEIHLLQVISSLLMILCYILFLILFDNKYHLISVIQSLYLLSCIFDINWFFFGVEDFKTPVIRNCIIKISSLFLIFLLIKNSNDVWIYTLILSGGTFVSQLIMWPFVHKYIIKQKIKIGDIKKHVIPCFKLFLPVIAVTIYKIMDKTMLGIFSTISEVGLYENAERIISVPISIIVALGTVMLPRMTNLYANNKIKESSLMINKSIKVIMFLSIPMFLGLISIGKDFSILFFGSEFKKTGVLIELLSITIIFLSWGNVIRTQYLIPLEKDKIYIVSAFLGAFINLIMNIIFIPMYSSVGACFGTIAAEFIVMFYQTFKIRKELPIHNYIKSIYQFIISGFIMFLILSFINIFNLNSLLLIFIKIITGSVLYFLLNYRFVFSELKTFKINSFSK